MAYDKMHDCRMRSRLEYLVCFDIWALSSASDGPGAITDRSMNLIMSTCLLIMVWFSDAWLFAN